MRFLPTRPPGIKDALISRLFDDILQVLKDVLNSNTYNVEMVWSVPFNLQIKTGLGDSRRFPPEIVRVARATPSDDLETPVHFGATQWSWNGDGSVAIKDVDGLVTGTKYRLVFEVVG